MSFALPTFGILAGLAGVAGVLYLLQRLRVRHREVSVVTTLFWRQAVEETRARVLVNRFRHLPAYLFALLIAGLLWLGFAEPLPAADAGTSHVLLLDGSASMAEGNRFEEAKARLLADVDRFPRGATQVIFCGGSIRTLLAPGESPLLLAKRLEGLQPEAAPESLGRVARSLAAEQGASIQISVYGAEAATSTREQIVALGAAPAASGRWDAVDVYASATRGSGVVAPSAASLDGAAPPAAERPGLWRDVPANGGRFVVKAGMASATLVLPARSVIRVQLDETLAPVLRAVLEADSGIRIVAEDPDVRIERGATAGTIPALRFVANPQATFLVTEFGDHASAAFDDAEVLRVAVRDLALAEVDGTALATALGHEVRVDASTPNQKDTARSVSLDAALLDPAVGFTRSRAFGLVIAGAVRHLAKVAPLVPYAAVGEPLPHVPQSVLRAGGRTEMPMGVAYTPSVAGDVRTPDGPSLVASVFADPSAAPYGDRAVAEVAGAGGVSFARLLALLALGLLLVEWVLVRRGRMP